MGDRRLFRRDAKADELVEESVAPAVVEPPVVPSGSPQAVDETCVRAPLTVTGVVSGVTVGSRGDAPALEATVDAVNAEGETQQVVLVWLGRSEIAGVQTGRDIVATARVCDEGGARVMYNPRYDLR